MNKKIKRTLVCLGVVVLFVGMSFMSGCKKADDTAATEAMTTQEQAAPDTAATEAPAAESEAPATQEATTEETGSGN